MKRNKIKLEKSGRSGLAKSRLGKKLLAWMLVAVLAVGAAPMKVSVQATVSGGDAAAGNEAEGAEENASGVMEEGERQGESAVLPHAEGDVLKGSVDGIVSGEVTWTYDPATKTTTVTGKGARVAKGITSGFPKETECIRFENCEISFVCRGLFGGLTNLKTIDISGLDTSNVEFMDYMFSGCSSLTDLDLSKLDTGNVIYMGSMFEGCSNLQNLDVSGFDTGSVTNMWGMFEDCSSLENLDLRSFDTGNVTGMGSMFEGCSSLANLDLSSFDTGNVTSMWSMLEGCSSLANLDLSSFNTSSVEEMSCMFEGCSNLTNLDLSSFNTGNVKNMGRMFCMFHGSSLISLDLSSFDTGNVTDMNYMFYGCSGLQSLDVSGFDTGNVTDMNYMFYGCSGLQSLDVSGFNTGNVTDMGGTFSGCSGLQSLDVSGFDTGNVTDMGGTFSGCSGLQSLDVSGFDTGNVTYMASMFSGCSNLQNLDVGGFNTGNVTNMGGTFSGCSGLQSLDVSGFNTGNVTNMGGTFSGCSGLQSLDVSGFNTGNVTGMGEMFSGCSNLQNLDVSGFDTGNVTYMASMFSGCSNLQNLDVGGFNTGNVTGMGRMFFGCSGLSNLDLSSFNTSSVEEMSCMFEGCSNLTDLDLSSFNTGNVKDMGRMFCMFHGSSLISLDLSSFDTGNVTNTERMFFGCSGLANLDLSSFDTGNVTNMNYMFYGCSGLTDLKVSGLDTSSVTDMRGTFSSCSSLASLDLSSFDMGNVNDVSGMFLGCKSLEELIAPRQMCAEPIALPADFVDPEGNTTSVLTAEYAGKKLTRALTAAVAKELPQAVMYAPYEVMLGLEGYGNFALESGTLPKGLSLAQNGTLSGVPAESGDFTFQVKASGQDVKERLLEYRLAVGQNTDVNVQISTNEGYELVETVPDLSKEDMSAQGEQTMCSVGAYEEFVALYLDGGKLVRGEGDTLTGDAEYLARPGSTRITILNQTLAKNGSGTHTLAMEFRKTDTGELRRAAQNYTIAEEQEPGPDDDRPGGDEPGDGNDDEPDGDDGTEENGGGDEGGGEDDSAEDDQGDTAAEGGAGLSGDPYESAYYDYEIDWEAVGRMIDAAEPEQSVDVLAGGCLSVPAWILEKCKAHDVILALHVGNGITLGITGEEIKQPESPFEANMVYQAQIPDSEKAALLKDALAGRVFEIAEPTGAGVLSCPVNVHFSWGSELAGKRSVLYHYEKESGIMAPVGSFAVTQAGQAMFGLSGSGGYIAVVCEDDAGEAVDAGGNGSSGEINDSSNPNSPGKNESKPAPSKDQEPKTGDAVPIRIYATLAMIAGFTYLLLCFTEGRRGMTEEAKKETVARLAGWARRGGKLRRMLAFSAIFVLLLYYHGTKNLYCPAKEGTCRKHI